MNNIAADYMYIVDSEALNTIIESIPQTDLKTIRHFGVQDFPPQIQNIIRDYAKRLDKWFKSARHKGVKFLEVNIIFDKYRYELYEIKTVLSIECSIINKKLEKKSSIKFITDKKGTSLLVS